MDPSSSPESVEATPSSQVPPGSSSDETMDVSVRSLNADPVSLNVPNTITLSDFRKRVEAEMGVTPNLQRLIFAGRVIEGDESLLTSFNISNGTVLHLATRPPPSSSNTDSTSQTPPGHSAAQAHAHHHRQHLHQHHAHMTLHASTPRQNTNHLLNLERHYGIAPAAGSDAEPAAASSGTPAASPQPASAEPSPPPTASSPNQAEGSSTSNEGGSSPAPGGTAPSTTPAVPVVTEEELARTRVVLTRMLETFSSHEEASQNGQQVMSLGRHLLHMGAHLSGLANPPISQAHLVSISGGLPHMNLNLNLNGTPSTNTTSSTSSSSSSSSSSTSSTSPPTASASGSSNAPPVSINYPGGRIDLSNLRFTNATTTSNGTSATPNATSSPNPAANISSILQNSLGPLLNMMGGQLRAQSTSTTPSPAATPSTPASPSAAPAPAPAPAPSPTPTAPVSTSPATASVSSSGPPTQQVDDEDSSDDDLLDGALDDLGSPTTASKKLSEYTDSFPPEWDEIISPDMIKQKSLPPQMPFSDTYRSHSSSPTPPSSPPTLFSTSMTSSLERAPISSGASQETILTGGQSTLGAQFTEYYKDLVRARLQRDADYQSGSDRFTNTSRVFGTPSELEQWKIENDQRTKEAELKEKEEKEERERKEQQARHEELDKEMAEDEMEDLLDSAMADVEAEEDDFLDSALDEFD
eukprot:TRINITY_DN3468_c0_g1_i1.p1 TRINITY_DN3468_c0_g1~~TRINITY_DN3468_c0_g1_i1.p1  ORF type:complete len:719 (-),score=204.48 TRINITY_DN3468_c0_g1_i1:145-2232(-)